MYDSTDELKASPAAATPPPWLHPPPDVCPALPQAPSADVLSTTLQLSHDQPCRL